MGRAMGVKFVAAFSRDGHEVITIAHESYFIHSVSGTDLNSYVNFSSLRLVVPLREGAAVGSDYILYHAEREYADYPDVSRAIPNLRAYLSWRVD